MGLLNLPILYKNNHASLRKPTLYVTSHTMLFMRFLSGYSMMHFCRISLVSALSLSDPRVSLVGWVSPFVWLWGYFCAPSFSTSPRRVVSHIFIYIFFCRQFSTDDERFYYKNTYMK